MSVIIALLEARSVVQIAHTGQDVFLQALLDGLEDWVQPFLGTHIYSGAAANHVEAYDSRGQKSLFLRKAPILSVDSVADLDDDDEILDADLYRATDTRIVRTDGMEFEKGDRRWRVTYAGGYTAATFPAGAKVQLLQLLYRGYNSRGGQESSRAGGASVSWQALLDSDILKALQPYKLGSVGLH